MHAFKEESEMMSMTDITAGHVNSVYSKNLDQTERDGQKDLDVKSLAHQYDQQRATRVNT